MQENNFETVTHAKCILAGEHSVIFGCPAVVVPIAKKCLSIHYEPNNQPVEMECKTRYEDIFRLFFWHSFMQGLSLLKKNKWDVTGKFIIKNNIRMGAGIGFSSALCVAITRWFIWEGWLAEDKLYAFAKKLEDTFHGQSSGVDIAGAIADHVIHFEKSGDIHPIQTEWKPFLYLSYSGHAKDTAEAVNFVKQIRKENPALAQTIDEEMKESVHLIEEGLKMKASMGAPLVRDGMELASQCFDKWHLISSELKQHMNELKQLGAVAVKPTGAGIGGYVLSLWDKKPSQEIKIHLIPIF